MKFFKVLMIAGVAALSLTSCNDWLDINNDPNTPTSADASLNARCVYMQHYSIASYMIPSSNTAYYCGQLATITGGQQTGAMNWNLSAANRANNAQQWFLVPVGGNLPDLYNQAMEKGAYHYAAMACDATNPKYNTGKEVFMGCIDLIEEAIELFQRQQDPTVTPLSAGDMWNGGDTGKWIKLCYLLKARWLNHLSKKAAGSYKDGKYDANEILACLDKAMKSNADNTIVRHEDNNSSTWDHEGWNEPVDYSTLYSCIGMNNNRLFVSKCFYDNLTNFDNKGIEDPRADKFIPWCRSVKSETTPAEVKWSDDGKWRRSLGVDLNSNIISNGGIKAATFVDGGWTCGNVDAEHVRDTLYVQGQSGSTGYGGGKDMLMRKAAGNDASALSGVFWTRPTSPTVVGSYAECCFIKAEVLFRQGNKAAAFEAYKAGIRAHIDYVNSVCQMWVAGDASLAEIPSFKPMSQDDIDNFMNNAIGTAGDLTMAKIMTQKQMVVFLTTEMWNDMRRFDYDPNIFMRWHKPYMYENTAAYWTYCPQGKYPRRWNQASYEKDYNAANLEAIGAQIPGALDLPVGSNGLWYLSDQICTLPVWWDSTQE